MLLLIASKTITRAIQERLKEAREPKLRDKLTGFRTERSCCEHSRHSNTEDTNRTVS